MRVSVSILLTLIFLTACSSPERLIEKRVILEKLPIVLTEVAPATQIPVDWTVFTKDNVDAKFRELEKDGTVAIFGLTPSGYQAMSLNLAELRRYIQQQIALIKAYRDYYETPLPQPAPEPNSSWKFWTW